MANQTVSVTLSAKVGAYIASMQAAAAATDKVSASGVNLNKLGSTMTGVGKAMTVGVTLPIVALGAASVAMAAKFETAFAQMVGLANVPAAEIDGLKESVLNLSTETGVAAQELAEGLYFAASAGLDTAQAMDAVGLAAQASAAGMGKTADVVGLVASATAAYGPSVMNAAKATDILTAAIREGRADPAELAGSMGRVLPVAAAMGISFEEVGGALAYMSNVMPNTEQAVTALEGALLKLSAPTAQGRQALLDMGTSFEELQDAISSDGLLGALELLREHGFDGNRQAIADLMPDIQGQRALTLLLADANGKLEGTMTSVADSTGSLDEAFSAVSETSAMKMKQAIAEISAAMIEVGSIVLPIVAKIAAAIGDLASWFSDLNPAVQGVVLAFAALAAVAGPLLIVAGSLVKNWGLVSTAMTNFASKGTTASKAMTVMKVGLGLLSVALIAYSLHQQQAAKHAQQFSDMASELARGNDELLTSFSAMLAFYERFEGMSPEETFAKLAKENLGAAQAVLAHVSANEEAEAKYAAVGLTIDEMTAALEAEVAAQATAASAADGAAAAVSAEGEAMLTAAEAAAILGAALLGAAAGAVASDAAMSSLVDGMSGAAVAVDGLAESSRAMFAALSAGIGGAAAMAGLYTQHEAGIMAWADAHDEAARTADELGAAIDRLMGHALSAQDAEDAYAASVDALAASLVANGAALDANSEAGRANREAIRGQIDAAVGHATAMVAAGASTVEATGALSMMREALVSQITPAFGGSRDAAAAYIDQLGLTPESINTAVVLADIAAREAEAAEYAAQLANLPSSVSTTVTAPGATASTGLIGAFQGAVGAVPSTASTAISAPGATQATGEVDGLRGTIDELTGKTVTVGANVFGQLAVQGLIGAIAGVQSKTVTITSRGVNQMLAEGGRAGSSGAIAGEAGPELLSLGGKQMVIDKATFVPPGTMVTPMSAGGGGGSGIASGDTYVTLNNTLDGQLLDARTYRIVNGELQAVAAKARAGKRH